MNNGILVADYIESEIRILYQQGAIKHIYAVAYSGKWQLLFLTDKHSITLISEKSKKARKFASLDTVATWVRDLMGNVSFGVDMRFWDGLPL